MNSCSELQHLHCFNESFNLSAPSIQALQKWKEKRKEKEMLAAEKTLS